MSQSCSFLELLAYIQKKIGICSLDTKLLLLFSFNKLKRKPYASLHHSHGQNFEKLERKREKKRKKERKREKKIKKRKKREKDRKERKREEKRQREKKEEKREKKREKGA